MDELRPLLGTTLVLVAHPDDEVLVCGSLMQRMQKAVVVFATDGAPRDEAFWKRYGSRQGYAEVRREEAREASQIVGASPVFLSDRVEEGLVDQELFRSLGGAIGALEHLIAQVDPQAILSLAYQGGHPDHDAVCFMATVAGGHAAIPVWESPLYHRNADGESVLQQFPALTGAEVQVRSECSWLEKKIQMFHAYRSQALVLDAFRPDLETFRPVAAYDFTRPPLPWKLNYEMWGWQISGGDVSRAFAFYLHQKREDV